MEQGSLGAQQRQPGVLTDAAVWEKIGRQTVEIDLLREMVAERDQRNVKLEAQLAEALGHKADDEPSENGGNAGATEGLNIRKPDSPPVAKPKA